MLKPQSSYKSITVAQPNRHNNVIYTQNNEIFKQNDNKTLKSRPKSYRNFSRVAQCMKDQSSCISVQRDIHYVNNIQGSNKKYYVPQQKMSMKPQKEHKFDQFFQKNNNKMYKPNEIFNQYSDLMSKNSSLLRRGQFNLPLGKEDFSVFKRSQKDNNQKTFNNKKYYTASDFRYTKTSNIRLGNTISQNFQNSIEQKRSLRKSSTDYFNCQRNKRKKTSVQKTFMDHVEQYDHLINKQRQQKDQIALKNAMSRMLIMQTMEKNLQNYNNSHQFT